MNQRCEPDSKTNTQPRRDRPKTKRQAPTNLIKSFQSEPSLSLKPELPASNRRGKRNSDQPNHHSGSLLHKTSCICSIHNKWLSSWNDQKNQFSLIYTQGRRKIMAPKSFVLYLILTPLNQYPLQGCNIFLTLSWTDSINPSLLFSNFVVSLYFRRIYFSDYLVCFTVFLKLLIHGFCKTWDKMLWIEYLNMLIWCRKIIDRYV